MYPARDQAPQDERQQPIVCDHSGIKKAQADPGSVGWALSYKPKGRQFDSRTGHIHKATDLMFLPHIDVSFPLLLSPPPSENIFTEVMGRR